jgi:F-type H+-transporting ATPase subunit b
MSTTVNLAATEDGETAVLGVPLGDLIISLIGFGLLLFVVWKFIAPAFEKAYAARTAAIEGGLAKAEEAQEQAARALEQYNRQLATARDEAAKIREEARTAAQAIRDDVLAQAHAESDRIAAQGRTQLEAQRQQILHELRADLGRSSVELASRIVGESLTDEARRQRTVERFLAELER